MRRVVCAWLMGALPAACSPGSERTVPAGVAAPEIFAAGTISDAREQWRITFTPDGRTAYFAASDGFFPFTRQATIYVSRRTGDGWSAPVTAPFSGTYSDMDPVVSPDGARLYFSSIRPSGGETPPSGGDARGDLDIWMVERSATGWSDAVRLGASVNTDQDELYASVTAAGVLYFARGPRAPEAGSHFDIYRAAPAATGFAPATPLGPSVNRMPAAGDPDLQAAWEFNPEVSADGSTLLFTSLRPGGHGLGDLYVSHFRDGEWTEAVNVGPPINTAADEYHPTVHDGWLYFVRRDGANDGNGANGDFFRVSLPPQVRTR